NRDKEMEGLENRIRNLRRKWADHQLEYARLEGALQKLQAKEKGGPDAVPTSITPPSPAAATAAATEVPLAPSVHSAAQIDKERTEVEEWLTVLEKSAGELADQRLQLVEQWQLLVQTQERWDKEQEKTVAELTELGKQLHEQELTLEHREEALLPLEYNIKQRLEEVLSLRQHLEGRQARLFNRMQAWESERDRLLANLKQREEAAAQTLAMLTDLRSRWEKRRRQETRQLRGERASYVKLWQECAVLRQD